MKHVPKPDTKEADGDESEGDSWAYQQAADSDLTGKARLTSERREVGLFGAALHGIARVFSKILIRLMLRIDVHGRENLPTDAPFVIVANHSSHFDAMLISDLIPARFTGKLFALAAADYFFDTPSKTIFATRWVNALPIRRGRSAGKALGTLRDRIVSGDCILIVFPEGTRSRDGALGKFKPGIGMLIAGTPVPVVPCRLDGAHEIWPPHRKFPRSGKVTLTVGEPVMFDDISNDKVGWLSISKTLRERVAGLSQSEI